MAADASRRRKFSVLLDEGEYELLCRAARLNDRAVAVEAARRLRASLAAGAGGAASSGLPGVPAPAASDEQPAAKGVAAEVAAGLPGVSFGSSLAGKFKPDPRGGK